MKVVLVPGEPAVEFEGKLYCPECDRPLILSGNWAGCRNRECLWQGRIRDLIYVPAIPISVPK